MKRHYEDAPEYPNNAYRVDGYSGIAWYVHGWETEPDEDTEWSGCENRTGKLVCTMVGDDRHFTFDPDEIIELPDDAYCSGCGQIGCMAG